MALTVGGFGSLRKYNELYEAFETESSPPTWYLHRSLKVNSGMEMFKHIPNQLYR